MIVEDAKPPVPLVSSHSRLIAEEMEEQIPLGKAITLFHCMAADRHDALCR
jgi:hypothetical protein